MTVYQEITHMDKRKLAKWILKLLREDESFCTHIYCRLLCEHSVDGRCDLSDDEDCVAGGEYEESSEQIILKWLDSDFE